MSSRTDIRDTATLTPTVTPAPADAESMLRWFDLASGHEPTCGNQHRWAVGCLYMARHDGSALASSLVIAAETINYEPRDYQPRANGAEVSTEPDFPTCAVDGCNEEVAIYDDRERYCTDHECVRHGCYSQSVPIEGHPRPVDFWCRDHEPYTSIYAQDFVGMNVRRQRPAIALVG